MTFFHHQHIFQIFFEKSKKKNPPRQQQQILTKFQELNSVLLILFGTLGIGL